LGDFASAKESTGLSVNTAGSAPWQITLLGGLRAEHRNSGATVTRFRSQKFGALLAYLALFPQRVHTREELADLLWPDADPEVARTNLRTALSSLRKQLEPPGTPSGSVLVTPGHGQLGLNPAAFETDVAAFDKAVKAAARPGSTPESQAARVLAQAADLYRGPLLPGFYETWALSERDRLAEAYLDVLRLLVQHHEQAGDPKTALVWARRAVAADVLDEQAHASVIRLLMAIGDRSGAHRQFDELTRLLDEQLGAEPSGEVRALLEARAGPIHRPSQKIAAFDTAFRAAAPSERTSGDNDTHFVESGAEAESPNTPLHLPLTLTRFFGRESETSVLAGLLREADTRLVTLTGPGGSGKTRLAIETARGLGGTFFGGIWFVPLADLHEAGRIPGAIADALCLPRSPQSAPLAQVADTLKAAGSGVRSQGEARPCCSCWTTSSTLPEAGRPLFTPCWPAFRT
jgi:DNA-binding SARP family transcriptional activator